MQGPRYEYSRAKLAERIDELLGLSAPHGLTVRYAMKANPHPEIVAMLHAAGVHFDASSSYEATELLRLGVPGERISLSSQQSPHNLPELLHAGVHFVATSLRQLDLFASCPSRPRTVGVRMNAGVGHGHNNRLTTGGVNSSFGIWHAYLDDVLTRAAAAQLAIDRVHVHIGSGADPSVWGDVMEVALALVERFPDATSLDIGGGYKVHRFGDEPEADMAAIAAVFVKQLTAFTARTGRKLALEIEPGTYFTAHCGTLVAYVDDIVDTGPEGHTFLRLNTGMNDFLRSTLYGARHRIEVINDGTRERAYVVVGHNCESGDILTPVVGDPESIEPRMLKEAHIGDEVRIYDTGAYCASMCARGYNAFPDADEVMVA